MFCRAATLLAASALALGACRAPDPAAPEPARPTPGPPALTLGPITYFETSCARCHGPSGAFFAPSLRERDDEDLLAIIREMAEGPAGAPIEGPDLLAQAALHRAFTRGEPFIARVTAPPGLLAFEVTPGADVRVLAHVPDASTRELAPTPDPEPHAHRWTLPAPPTHARAEVLATLAGVTTRLDPARQTWSLHPDPLPPTRVPSGPTPPDTMRHGAGHAATPGHPPRP